METNTTSHLEAKSLYFLLGMQFLENGNKLFPSSFPGPRVVLNDIT